MVLTIDYIEHNQVKDLGFRGSRGYKQLQAVSKPFLDQMRNWESAPLLTNHLS
jgi:hypothetical protein